MANITITRGTTLPDSSAKSDFHGLVDNASATISSIENADISNSAAIAASKLNLATVAQDIAMSGKVINFAKGSDIASATTTDIGASTGNFVDITGTTTITGLGTVQDGTIRFVRFIGILTLTHNGTSLILPTTANITTAANDRAIFASLGSGNWICLAYQRADGTPVGSAYTPTAANALTGSVIQDLYTQDATKVNGTTTIPYTSSAVTTSQGTEYTQIATTITPNNASNKLVIDVLVNMSHSSGDQNMISLFQDAGANALQTTASGGSISYQEFDPLHLRYQMTAGTTSATTFKIRFGPSTGGTSRVNSDSTGGTLFNSLYFSSMRITEIKA